MEEDGALVEFPLKRKIAPKEEIGAKRLQVSPKGLKPRTTFCSTLKEGGLSSKKLSTRQIPPSVNQNSVVPNLEKGVVGSSGNAAVEKQIGKEELSSKNCNDGLGDSAENRNRVDEHHLLSPKSSPEMAVKGS